MKQYLIGFPVALVLVFLVLESKAQVRGSIRRPSQSQSMRSMRPSSYAPLVSSAQPSTYYPTQNNVRYQGAYPTQNVQYAPSYQAPYPTQNIQFAPARTTFYANAGGSGYALPATSPTANQICDARWAAALQMEVMNVDDWRCTTKLASDGVTQLPCLLTGPNANSVFKNLTACGWKMPVFCDATIADLAQSLLKPSVSTAPVPVGYTLIPGVGYYKIHTELKTWDQAKLICESDGVGTHLAVPSSSSDYAAIMSMISISLPNQITGLYVGLTDVVVEGQFVSVTGQPLCTLGQALFQLGEPNNSGGGEHCLTIGYRKGAAMNDYPCLTLLPFVCEQPLPSTVIGC